MAVPADAATSRVLCRHHIIAHPLTAAASVVRVGQSYQKNGRAREGSAFSAHCVSVSSNKCVLPLLLGVLLTIGCDVGGDEAAADNRCAHRPPPPAIVNPFTYLCGPPQPGASRRPSTSAEFRLELRSRRWAAAACSPSTARAATAEARSRASETRRAKEYGLLQPSSRADALPPA